MFHYFVRYCERTGDIVTVGHTNTPGEIPLQGDANKGLLVVEADGATIMAGTPSRDTYLEAVRVHLCRTVDDEARSRMSDPFMDIHAAQAAEARGETVGTPYLDALRSATGQTEKDVVLAIKEQAAAADAMKARINARRQAAKRQIRAATTIGEIVAAGVIDWDA